MGADKKTVGAKVDPELYNDVEAIAEERDVPMSDILEDVIRRGVEDRHWTRHLAPIFKEATNVSTAFAFLVPMLMLFFTDHPIEDAFLLGLVFVLVGVVSALIAIYFAEDPDEVFG